MALRVVRLGTPRAAGEGIRLGTVRRPPRGVPKADYSRLNYFDVWLPELAPSEDLLRWVRSRPMTESRWSTFARRYRAELARPPASRVLQLVAAMSRQANLSIGCFCAEERHCHRSLLRELLVDAGGVMAGNSTRS
jgi:uncharacterized protein YeaO (DUF488 family)